MPITASTNTMPAHTQKNPSASSSRRRSGSDGFTIHDKVTARDKRRGDRQASSSGASLRRARGAKLRAEQGAGEAVVCIHGVPTSSFLYRKVLAELAGRDLRGVAFDLPGLGLAGRPEHFDYTWTGLGRFCVAAIDALELERLHLVVHDIGGPVGFELAAAMPERVMA